MGHWCGAGYFSSQQRLSSLKERNDGEVGRGGEVRCDHRAVTNDRTLREELVGLLTASCGSRERMGKGDSCNYKSSGGDDRWLKMEIKSGSEERLQRVPNSVAPLRIDFTRPAPSGSNTTLKELWNSDCVCC